jgi:hypothetical protein
VAGADSESIEVIFNAEMMDFLDMLLNQSKFKLLAGELE